MSCEWCEGGKQNVRPNRGDTVMRGHLGGFASHVRASNWRFAHPIPDAIASEHAGPLLCAGTTVFAPLLRNGVRPTDKVAVVGHRGARASGRAIPGQVGLRRDGNLVLR